MVQMYGVCGSNIWPEMMPDTEGLPIGDKGVSLGQKADMAYLRFRNTGSSERVVTNGRLAIRKRCHESHERAAYHLAAIMTGRPVS